MTLHIFWSDEDEGYIATDSTRPGCCAWGETEDEAGREIADAQAAWDEAKALGETPFILLGQFKKNVCKYCGRRKRKDCYGNGWLEPLGPYRDGSYMTSRPCPNDDPFYETH